MKKLGLIGGMGPESTIPYYHDIVYGVQNRLHVDIFPELSIESVNVFKVLSLCEQKKYDELVAYLMHAIRNLENSGADFIALSANTPHIVFDELQKQAKVPMVSIIEATCQEAIKKKIGKIGLLGTKVTMNGEFYRKPFMKNHIEIVIPKADEIDYIHNKISTELELGIVKDATLKAFQDIIERMKREDDIQAIVLGCTELPLLLNDAVSPVRCLDTMKIHVDTLVTMICE